MDTVSILVIVDIGSQFVHGMELIIIHFSFNPCYSGYWFSISMASRNRQLERGVSILVIVDIGSQCNIYCGIQDAV